jgi:general secretion pathway protein D
LPAPTTGGLNLRNASLTEVIDVLARQLKISYILDPRVKGGVTVNTYGETKGLDTKNLLDLVLRINGAAIVRVEDNLYRVVPLADVTRMPLQPQVNATEIPANDAPMLNLIFLKYATVEEVAKLLDPFIGEGGRTVAYPPANLLLIQDSQRNMRRLMDLIALFDADTFAGQRVKLFEMKNSRPSDIARELENIFKGISLNEKSSPIRFLPIDRISTLIGVAANPGVFEAVESWIKKLDIPVQITAGTMDNYVYRVKYGRAETLAMSIMSLYFGYGHGMYGGGMGGMYGGMGGMYGGGMGGMYGGMGGMYGGGMYGGGMYGGGMGGMYSGGMGFSAFTPTYQPNAGVMGGPIASVVAPPAAGQVVVTGGAAPAAAAQGGAAAGTDAGAAQRDQTGQYLGSQTASGVITGMPRIVPNQFDNSLLIQATPQDYAGILKLLRELDVPPRQVLIDAHIYEVDLTGAFSAGVQAWLQAQNCQGPGCVSLNTNKLTGTYSAAGLALTAGTLVGASRELLGALQAAESTGNVKVISAPSIIATDSIPASLNVGVEVPTITGQAVTGIQSGGDSLFAQNIQNRNTGVTLNILARVNASGIVTMVVNQEVSSPGPPPTGTSISSPTFSKRNISTQITVQDGDTVAIGGIIDDKITSGSSGIPGLHRIPIIGWAFGTKSYSRARTELVVFLTPRVIYDTADMVEASNELRSRLKRVNRLAKDF